MTDGYDWNTLGLLRCQIVGKIGYEDRRRYVIHPLGRQNCPVCNDTMPNIETSKYRDVIDRYGGETIDLQVLSQSYTCRRPDCIKTSFRYDYGWIAPNAKYTKRFIQYMTMDSLWLPFNTVAKKYEVSPKTVRSCLKKFLQNPPAVVPEAPSNLGIEELVEESGERHLLVTDVTSHYVLNVVKNERSDSLANVLDRIENPENVSTVLIPMKRPIKQCVSNYFPRAQLAVSQNQVIQYLQEELLKIQEKAVASRNISVSEVRLWLATMREEPCMRNVSIDLKKLFAIIPELKPISESYDKIADIYQCKTRTEAKNQLDTWIDKTSPNNNALSHASRELEKWKNEILNFWDRSYVPYYTALDNMLNSISKTKHGYQFPVLRARILYGQLAEVMFNERGECASYDTRVLRDEAEKNHIGIGTAFSVVEYMFQVSCLLLEYTEI